MSDNAAIPDKMQFAARPEAHSGRQWVPDERDGFILWLRGEFAAANAIIDSLCHHLRTTGEPGEYDMVLGCIQQRRYNWTPVLHMQQYFSIAEVMMALQQAVWQKQQRGFEQQPKHAGKDFRRNSFNHRHGNRFDGGRDGYGPLGVGSGTNAIGEWAEAGRPKGRASGVDKEGGEGTSCSKVDSNKDCEKAREMELTNLNPPTKEDKSTAFFEEGPVAIARQEEANELFPVPKTFVCNETCDGKMVNVFEGLRLYEDLLDKSDVIKICSLVNTLRSSGWKGDLQGQTFVSSRKLSRGHGKDIIQLGTCICEGSLEDETAAGSQREKKVEPIPSLLQAMLDRLVQQQVVISRPDYCAVDFFNEGDHSLPHLWLLRYGRPIYHLVLTDCDMVFGRMISSENRGEYRGSLALSLRGGSLLVLQGKSADMAKRAIPSICKHRIILTFGKSQRDSQIPSRSRQSSSMSPSALPWGQHSNRQINPARRPSGPKNYGIVSGSGVLQGPHVHPLQPSTPNGIQPLFVAQMPVSIAAAPYTPSVPAVPVSSGWTVVPPRKADVSRLPVPGTGVFLPPTGSGHSTPHQLSGSESSTPTNSSSAEVQCTLPENEQSGKLNSSSDSMPGHNYEESSTLQSCNGGTDNCNVTREAKKEGEHSLDPKKQPSKLATPIATAGTL